MNIYYTNETLYVDCFDNLNDNSFTSMKRKVMKILNDYEINNVTLSMKKNSIVNKELIDNFKIEYDENIQGKLKIN